LSYFWTEKWDRLKWWLKPRQKWLIKKIPNHWEDKDVLIELVLEECLIHFIEDEKGLHTLPMHLLPEFEEAYNYLRMVRPNLERELNDAQPKMVVDDMRKVEEKEVNGIKFKVYTMKSVEEVYGMPYAEAYKRYNELSKLIEEKDKSVHDLIYSNREYLWS